MRAKLLSWVVVILVLFANVSLAAGRPLGPTKYSLPGYVRGARNVPAKKVIVFVHGFIGNGESTWTNSTTGAYFPELLRDDDVFRDTNIWVHNFPSSLTRASYSIDELADHLRRHLNEDNVIFNHQQIIFVAHSLGGLVVRAYLLKYRDQVPPESVPMLYFFSTPTTGTDLANFVKVVSRNSSLGDMSKMRTNAPGVLGTFGSQWSSSAFPRVTRSYCAYETLRTYGIQVVQRESAEHLCNSRLDPIALNHIDISKPADRRDESYISFRDAFRETFQSRATATEPSPLWNIRGNRPSFVRVSKSRASPDCDACWSSELEVKPGERVFVATHFENYGNVTARGVRLQLHVPDSPTSGHAVFGTLTTAGGGNPLQGAACLIQPNIPILLYPVGADWYPNGSSNAVPLPYEQAAPAVTSERGLEVGDVSAGVAFESDVIVEFHTIGVSLLAVRNAAQLEKRIRGAIGDLGLIDFAEMNKVLASAAELSDGGIDYTDSYEPRGWVSHLKGLKRGERILLCVFINNESAQPLHSASLIVDPGSAGPDERYLRVSINSREHNWELGKAPITFSTGASSLVYREAYFWPYGFCATGTRPFSDIPKLALRGNPFNGMPIGDLPAVGAPIYAMLFEVK